MTIPVGVIYALWSLVQDVGVFSRVFGRVLINKDFDRMILILNNLCKVLNMFFKWIIAFPIHIHGCQLLVIKWIDIDLSSSSGVVKCCVIIGLSNLTSLGPTFPVKWGNIYKKILPLELFVHIVSSHKMFVLVTDTWEYLILMNWVLLYALWLKNLHPFHQVLFYELCSFTGASLKIWVVKS